MNFGHCEKVVKRWTNSAVNQEAKADTHTLHDLLFFLHVPRTGGRAYFHWYSCVCWKYEYESFMEPVDNNIFFSFQSDLQFLEEVVF